MGSSEQHPSLATASAWRSVYLIGDCIFKRPKREPSGREAPELYDLFSGHSITLGYSDVTGTVFQVSTRTDTLATESTHHQNFYFVTMDPIAVQDFLVVRVIAKLRPKYVDEIFSEIRDKGTDTRVITRASNRLIGEWLDDRLPKAKYVRVREFENWYPHVLYFDPAAQLISPGDTSDRSKALPLVERLRQSFGLTRCPEIPAIFDDVVLLPGIGSASSGAPKSSYVAVRVCPNDFDPGPWSTDYGANIPLFLISLLNHATTCFLQMHYRGLLASMTPSASEYERIGKSWSDFSNYRTEYMKMRLTADNLMLKATELSSAAAAALRISRQFAVHSIDFAEFVSFDSPLSNEIKHSVSDVIRVDQRNAHDSLHQALEIAKTRLATLDNFVRDAAVADSTNTNLMFAKKVERLTWVVIVIGVLSLLASLVPDGVKLMVLEHAVQHRILESLAEGEKASPPTNVFTYSNDAPAQVLQARRAKPAKAGTINQTNNTAIVTRGQTAGN